MTPPPADQTQTANQAKTRFLANVSHELRTPLNAIMGFMEILAETDLDAQQRYYVDLSKEAAMALLQLIEDLLDSGKIEAGYLELKPCHFRVRRLIGTVLAMHQPLAEQKGLFLRSNVEASVAEWWYGDEGRIRQVLSNLVHNSLKFTHTGGVEVVVTCEEGQGLRFEVRDTGIGLQAEDSERIFEAFTQVDDAASRHYGGTGLGLSICRQLVQLMGGEINVVSQPGQGSVFWILLPLQQSGPPEQMTLPADGRVRMGQLHGRVLVVEDNRLNQALLSEMLKSLGCEVDVVANGKQALHIWQARQFDLILMDCQLPGMDGYQIVSRIKALESRLGRSSCPVVALTADVSEGVNERCEHAGMEACLHKPVTVEKLYACLKAWLGRDQVSVPDKSVVEERQIHAIFNVSAWRQIEKLTEDQDSQLLNRVLSLYRQQGRQWLQTLAQALIDHDERTIVRTAHSFRSSCVHVGAADLAQWLVLLENSPEQADARLLAILGAGYRRVCCLLGAEIQQGD